MLTHQRYILHRYFGTLPEESANLGMEFKWKQAQVNVDGSPLQVTIPSLSLDEEAKKTATKAVVGLALGGVSGAVAIGGVFALDEWGAVRGTKKLNSTSKSRDSTPVTDRSGRRRCRVQHARTLTKEAKLAARNERREREKLLMKQMGFDANQMQAAGVEPRGRYQLDSPSASPMKAVGGMGLRCSSLPELKPAGAAAESPSMCESPFSDSVISPREQRRRREKSLMLQMAEKRREEERLETGTLEIPASAHHCEMAAQMADLMNVPAAGDLVNAAPTALPLSALQAQAANLGVQQAVSNAAVDKEQLRAMIRNALEQKLSAQPVTAARLLPSTRTRGRSRSRDGSTSRPASLEPRMDERDPFASEPAHLEDEEGRRGACEAQQL